MTDGRTGPWTLHQEPDGTWIAMDLGRDGCWVGSKDRDEALILLGQVQIRWDDDRVALLSVNPTPPNLAFPEQSVHDWTGVIECAEGGCERAAVDRDWFCAAHMEAGDDVG